MLTNNLSSSLLQVGDLRRAIPAHCFERSALKSGAYLLVDLLVVTVLYLFSTKIDTLPVPAALGVHGATAVRAACWALYWFLQGAVCTGACSWTPAGIMCFCV